MNLVGPRVQVSLPERVPSGGDSHTSTHGAFGALAFGSKLSGLATASAPISPMLVAGCIVVSTGGNEDVDHQNKGIQIEFESKGILNLNISEPIKHFLMDSY